MAKLAINVLTAAALGALLVFALVVFGFRDAFNWLERHLVYGGSRKAQERARWKAS